MRALRCKETGDLDRLAVEEVPDPEVGAGMVVVDVKAAAVNFVDTLVALGTYQIPASVPFTPGNDVAGVVSALGPDCETFAVGDRVHGMAFLGAFAERVAVAESKLRLTSDGLDHDLACMAGSTYRTAYDALVSTADLQPGDDLVILGASGAVGSAAIMIAKALGARVIACASTEAKLEFCRNLGADELVAYTRPGLKDTLKALCDGGADVVLDMVGGEFSEPALRATGYGGRFVVVGFAAGQPARIPLNLVLLKGSIILGYEIADFERRRSEAAARNRTELEAMFSDGRVKPPITGRYALDEAPDAMRVVATRDTFGATVIEIP